VALAPARVLCFEAMNARADHLLDEVLELPADERSAVAIALIDSLEAADTRAISEAWRAELLLRRERLRTGTTPASPWMEARARMANW
jgi:putative addiction module component (TIGR02574 family)